MDRFRFPMLSILLMLAAVSGVSFGLTGRVVPLVGPPKDEIVLQSGDAQGENGSLTTGAPEVSASPEVSDAPEVDDDGEDQSSDASSDRSSEGKERSTEGCPEGFEGNHGEFVSQSTARPRSDAAHSDCGKPVKSVGSDHPAPSGSPEVDGAEDDRSDPGQGHAYGHDKDKNKDEAKSDEGPDDDD
jgi:hypothetical protein